MKRKISILLIIVIAIIGTTVIYKHFYKQQIDNKSVTKFSDEYTLVDKNNVFVYSNIDEVANMSKYRYSAYMKLTFGGANSLVLNSGPRDNRLSIGRIEDGEEWALIYEAYDKTEKPISLNFDLGEYIYIPQRDGEYNFYEKVTTNPKIYFDKVVNPS